MTMYESAFEDENELHEWISENLEIFLPGTKYLRGIHIWTVSGKRGLPDGFGINFQSNKWYILESELLSHGVWPHIAEQLTRYVVAVQNSETRRKIRDHIFETVLETDIEDQVCEDLNTVPRRLFQKLEMFVEGIDPEVIVFIDDTNKDLYDLAHALSAQIKIFRIKKYIVNEQTAYHSPDQQMPALDTEPSVDIGVEISEYDVVEEMGGGELHDTQGRFNVYKLREGTRIHIKRSKFHESKGFYWYAITEKALENIEKYQVGKVCFVMGNEGFVAVPFEMVESFLEHTSTTKNDDGSIRHYHLLISPGPEPVLYYFEDGPRYPLQDFYRPF